MNILEKLYETRKELDAVLSEIEVEQSKLESEITEKRNISWNKMFEDLYSLKKYSRSIDTGVELYKGETLGFEIRNDGIGVISWEHFNGNGKQIEPRKKTYFFTITQDKPFQVNSIYHEWMEYVIKAIENWSEVMKEIEKRLVKRMELEMTKKITVSEQKQTELENQLKAINN